MPDLSRPTVVIFSQGDEVITGATVDTNAAFLADHCRTLGFDVIRHITVADELADMIRVMREIDGLADICLCTGGLGPTQDDLTSDAFSQAFNVPLKLDNDALIMMQDYFGKLAVDMPEVNRKQAFLPTGATRIDNHWGTAAGFISTGKQCRFYFMPGVPYEMKNMMRAVVLDDLRLRFKVDKTQLITLRTMGMGESAIQQEIDKLSIPNDVRISFRAGLPENELKLVFPSAYKKQTMQACVDQVQSVLKGSVFAVDGLGDSVENLADCVHQLMQHKNETLSVIETLSQGDISRQCNAHWLKKSLVFPQVSDIMPPSDITATSINEDVACQLAKKQHANNDSSLTLVQLYDQIGDDKVVYIAVAGNQFCKSKSKTLTGRLHRQQIVASATALNLLRKYLLEH